MEMRTRLSLRERTFLLVRPIIESARLVVWYAFLFCPGIDVRPTAYSRLRREADADAAEGPWFSTGDSCIGFFSPFLFGIWTVTTTTGGRTDYID
jgi:hypothetical protein